MRQGAYLWALTVAAIVPCTTASAQVFRGVVRDSETEKPVWIAAVILVDFYNKVRAVGMTDSVGRYELVAPGPGRYRVRADAKGYRHEYSGEYIVQASDTVEVDFLVIYEPEPPSQPAAHARRAVWGDRAVRRAMEWLEPISRE